MNFPLPFFFSYFEVSVVDILHEFFFSFSDAPTSYLSCIFSSHYYLSNVSHSRSSFIYQWGDSLYLLSLLPVLFSIPIPLHCHPTFSIRFILQSRGFLYSTFSSFSSSSSWSMARELLTLSLYPLFFLVLNFPILLKPLIAFLSLPFLLVLVFPILDKLSLPSSHSPSFSSSVFRPHTNPQCLPLFFPPSSSF